MDKKILLIDSHPLVFWALEPFVNQLGYHLIKDGVGGDDIYNAIITHRPDVVIIDIYQSQCKFEEMRSIIRTLSLECKVIVFAEYNNLLFQKECYDMGISAYIYKGEDLSELLKAIQLLETNHYYYPGLVNKLAPRQIREFDAYIKQCLSLREQDVLKKLSAGYSVKEISSILDLSIKTVSTHKVRLIKKLGCKNLVHALDTARFHEVD